MLKFTYFILEMKKLHEKFSIFIWKTWKSQGIFKFIFCNLKLILSYLHLIQFLALVILDL